MDIKTPTFIISLLISSVFLTACCQQPQSSGSNRGGTNKGNCHTHNDNAKRGTIRHCHAYTNVNHTHNYGNQRARVTPRAQVKPRPRPQPNYYYYPSYDNSKRKGNYRGSVDNVIDPYAKNVMRDYRRY